MNRNNSLQGKVALITGGAGLLGVQHAKALLEIGATVYLGDISANHLKNALHKLSSYEDKIKSLILDVTSKDSIFSAKDTILSQSGSFDILVNNAAIDPKVTKEGSKDLSRLEFFELDNWNFQISVGLTGAFLCSQVFGTHMANTKGGVILNIASDLSVIAPDQRIYQKPNVIEQEQSVKPVTYSVIKTALVGLTKYLATYWADKNIRVNALSPGGVFTSQPEEFVAKLTHLIPMKRMANLDEYMGAVQFLCSDDSKYMTGQNVVIDGGRTVW